MLRELGPPAVAVTVMMLTGCFNDLPPAGTPTTATAGSGTRGGTANVCTPGSVTCPCYGNGTCDAGLSCQTDLQLCIPIACSAGTNNCVCDGGACAASLSCVGGLCQADPGTTTDDSADAGTASTGLPPTTGSTSAPDTSSGGGIDCPTNVVTDDGDCARIVFLSSATFLGAGFSGGTGADIACNDAAGDVPLPGNYAALLWTTMGSGPDRVGLMTDDPYVFVLPTDGGFVPISMDAAALMPEGGGPMVPIDVHANGDVFTAGSCGTGNFVWTGADTGLGPGDDCSNWANSNVSAVAGNPALTGGDGWTNECVVSCTSSGRFYCFQTIEP